MSERKETTIFRQDIFCGTRNLQGVCHAYTCLFFLWEMERNHLTHNLIAADQTVPDWLIKITFLREVETVVRSNIKSGFSIMSF